MNSNLRSTASLSVFKKNLLTLSWRKPLSYRNQSIDLLSKSMDWFLYGNGLRMRELKFIRQSPNSVFNWHNYKGIKYLTRLRLGLSHLREHKFKHSFQDTLNPFCSCDLHVETNTHFFLYCPLFSNQRCTLLRPVNDIDSSFTSTNDSILAHSSFW